CDRETFGKDCSLTCSEHCKGEDNSCDNVDGTCDQGCDPGYQGAQCTQVLPPLDEGMENPSPTTTSPLAPPATPPYGTPQTAAPTPTY
ncbi:receptor-type tyrosine-protein phosphatase T, partial [Elysia marginata]